MQAMFHYSIKQHVSYTQEEETISYPVDFSVSHHLLHILCGHCTTYDPPYALGYI